MDDNDEERRKQRRLKLFIDNDAKPDEGRPPDQERQMNQ